MRARRLMVAIGIGCLSAILCYAYLTVFRRIDGDLGGATHMVPYVLAGANPYLHPQVPGQMVYPVTTVLFSLPFFYLPVGISAAVFIGLSSFLLALGATQEGRWERLLIFAAFPYWVAIQTVQWSPLLFAVALYPWLLPLTLVKPHIGLPVALTNLTKPRILACVGFVLISLLFVPLWPLYWYQYPRLIADQYLPPLLTLPFGPLLLFGLVRYKEKPVQYLLLLSLMPQRLFYDVFLLWYVVETKTMLLLMAVLSWLLYFVWFFVPALGQQLVVILLYLPALAYVLLLPSSTAHAAEML